MLRKHRTKEKRNVFVLLMAMAVLLALPPSIMAQGTDMYFEAEDFGDNYAYGFSHEAFGGDLIYNFTHQSYGDDYIYGFSHQIYGRDYIYSFTHGIFGSDYIYGFSHEGFGDDYNGNFSHQGFGAPLGNGVFILLTAGACYAVKRSKKKEVRSPDTEKQPVKTR